MMQMRGPGLTERPWAHREARFQSSFPPKFSMEEMELLPNLIKVAVGGGGMGETANPCFVARVKTQHAFHFDGCGVATVFVDPPP